MIKMQKPKAHVYRNKTNTDYLQLIKANLALLYKRILVQINAMSSKTQRRVYKEIIAYGFC